MASELRDLRSPNLLSAMLLDTWAWRERAIERLTLSASDHIEASTRFQVHIPSAALPRDIRGVSKSPVRLYLPLSTRPKEPLLHFALHAPEGRAAQLLTRRRVAELQAALVRFMLAETPMAKQLQELWPDPLLHGIFRFTPGIFRNVQENLGVDRGWRRGRDLDAVKGYLEANAGLDLATRQLEQCAKIQASLGEQLADNLGEEPDPYSSSERPLLAIPFIDAKMRPATGDETVELIERYARGIELAEERDASSVLAVLGEYGRRWQVVIDTVVHLDVPESFGTTDHRPFASGPSWRRRLLRASGQEELRYEFEWRDAPSFHCEVHSPDHRIELSADYTVRTAKGRQLGFPYWEAVRHTPEFLSLYTSAFRDDPRPALYVPLRPVAHVRWPTRFIILLTVGAIVAAWVVDFARPANLLTAFALITFPTTFAVALLLLREGSGLSARLQVVMRIALTGLTTLLWTVVLARALAVSAVG